MIASRYRAWLEDGRPEDLEPELAQLLPALSTQARRLLRHASDADDAVQDAMVELLRTRQEIPVELPLPAVAHRLVRERALMRGRTEQRRRRHEELLCSDPPTPITSDPALNPDALLQRLKPALRRICQGLADGLSRAELAEREGISVVSLGVQLCRARERLAASVR